MEFENFKNQIQKKFKEMTKYNNNVYMVNADPDKLWDLYLDSFPTGTNEVYRKRRKYDCSCCRQFIKTIGNIVTIENNEMVSVWDLNINDGVFSVVSKALSKYIKSKKILQLWKSNTKSIGTNFNFEKTADGYIKKWNHFYLEIPEYLRLKNKETLSDIKNDSISTYDVFKRGLNELTIDSFVTILELINQGSIYRGEEWKTQIRIFLAKKMKYNKLKTQKEKDLFIWSSMETIYKSTARLRNTSIGTLLVNISEGMDLDTAVTKYEKIVAPENYKRPKAIYTQRMLNDAKKILIDLGYSNSLKRRFANKDDITINNVLFSHKDLISTDNFKDDIFNQMSSDIAISSKKFSKVQKMNMEDFIRNVLPTASNIEVLFENRHENNLVSLIAPVVKDSKTMFKWNNNFSWAYHGNITDSSIKENVKLAGGKVNGVLRFSIQWNDDKEYDGNDLDAHCITPRKNEIYYCEKKDWVTKGELDVDIIRPIHNKAAVENIIWETKNSMSVGTYKFFVHCFNNRGGRSGFRAEIEFNGEVYSYNYTKPLRQDEKVQVADVYFDGENFTIKEKLDSSKSVKELWGIKTGNFVPVTMIMYSPNFWDQQGIGNKHYFFMLQGCKNTEKPNGMFNEYLKNDLLKHKRVFEALGSKIHVDDSDDQLSGLGFSTTRPMDLIVKVKGCTERILRLYQ